LKRISTGKAAKRLGVGVKTVLRYIQAGDLPAEKLPGGHYRIKDHDVEALMSEDRKVLELARRAGL
jgi:excisionase family DNA binding protein